jgi:hypothetical protein
MTTYDYPDRRMRARPAFSVPSIIAIIAAIMSFFAGAGWGLILAIVAIVAGLIGLAVALAPGVRGGLISFISIGAGLLGIIAAVLKLIF